MGARMSRSQPLDGYPFVTVVLPVRNEEGRIARTLEAVCTQEYPRDRVEILVVDGESADGTTEIVSRITERDPRVRLLNNPARIVPPGLNLALRVARGDVIVRVDGHCVVPPDYVRTCVEMLRDGPADCAGGPQCAIGDNFVTRAIALAMSTRFGVGGGASFRSSGGGTTPREVDHLPYGAWRREVFDTIGGFDEELVRNQDDEFSDRLRRAGGRILLHPRLVVRYWSRATLLRLWRQYYEYGFWKVRVIQKRGGRPSSPRHLAPAALVLALAGAALASLAARRWEPLALFLAVYLAFLAVATLVVALQRRDPAAVLMPAAMATLQVAYGAGFLMGAWVHRARGGAGRTAHAPS